MTNIATNKPECKKTKNNARSCAKCAAGACGGNCDCAKRAAALKAAVFKLEER